MSRHTLTRVEQTLNSFAFIEKENRQLNRMLWLEVAAPNKMLGNRGVDVARAVQAMIDVSHSVPVLSTLMGCLFNIYTSDEAVINSSGFW